MRALKKSIKLGVVSIIVFGSIVGSLSAQNISQIPSTSVEQSVQILDSVQFNKYDSAFKEMEKELKSKLKTSSIAAESENLKTNLEDTKVYTKTFEEGNSAVTLGLVYSTASKYVGTDDYITFGRVSLRTYYDDSQNQTGTTMPGITLKSIEGSILAIYDGAQYVRTRVVAGQGTLYDPVNSRGDNFTITSKSYSKPYSYPYILNQQVQVGQSATFYFISKYGDSVQNTVDCQYY
ncbi:hypothetical protein [Cellulosilyticum sp. I15G10I2]|uniref:hypothetical protein n=1 Tax=Cellulosilyticum sp. I15G10I2 TaxID=1892843 RepID=UPI00085C5D3D|nr:hypothetical protein [Cellulosilyticum sp. I15G10I2]